MNRTPKGVVRFSAFGLLVSLWFLYVGVSFGDASSFIIGISWLMLIHFLIKLRNWARITGIVLGAVGIALCVMHLILFLTADKFFGIALIFYFPGTLLGFAAIIYFNRDNVKAYFKQ